MVLCGTKNGSSMTPFEAPLFLSVHTQENDWLPEKEN